MNEVYWNRRQRMLNEDTAFRRERQKQVITNPETQDPVGRLRGEIRRRERSEQLKTLNDWMHKEKLSVLEEIAACSSLRKNQWHERLSEIQLTLPGADAGLKNLIEEVECERRLWRDRSFGLADLPDGLKTQTGSDSGLPIQPESTALRKPSPTLNALELRWAQERGEKELERKLNECDLALIASSLALLIGTRKLYESTLSIV